MRETFNSYDDMENARIYYAKYFYKMVTHADRKKEDYWIEAEPTSLTPRTVIPRQVNEHRMNR